MLAVQLSFNLSRALKGHPAFRLGWLTPLEREKSLQLKLLPLLEAWDTSPNHAGWDCKKT